ncbi:hypothetical protein BJ875DRAFT_95573 [Amylocarpus encephaloides]|uniref:Mucin-7 protein n=1 Tax=Amylocarpus encephaloides TaxID=45428 RepID=A0A9P7YQF8_9HELO|nr:hypothetical protein BJ875DRAFT_95573 [Amylocarpus encephaloides]
MSGVRGLLAKFENKDLSPAEGDIRGRSPGGEGNGEPAKIGRVRTSFVAVEGANGQLGMRRDDSTSSVFTSTSQRRTSFSENNMSESKVASRPEIGARKRSSLGEAADSAEATKDTDKKVEEANGIENKKEPVVKTATNKSSEKAGGVNTNGSSKSAAVKPVEKSTASKATSRPAPIATSRTAAASKSSPKKPLKSPAPPKTPTTPSRSHAREVKEPEKKATKTILAPPTSKPTRRPSTTSAQASKTRIQESPPQTGFKKPKPRSPTRPVKLPASLMAHTASSGSKTNASPPQVTRQSLSRASGTSQPINSLQAHHAASRSPSRASTTTTKSTLTRKPSALKSGGGRPSLGPPPQVKRQPSRSSLPHQAAPTDDSFLARMMRPTTASASKTAEKPTEPPKRATSVRRPVTKDGPPKPHDTSKASPVQNSRQAAQAKVVTKPTKPVERSPKTLTNPTAPIAMKTPKAQPKAAVEAPVSEKKVPEPMVEKEAAQEPPVDTVPSEPTTTSEPVVEKVSGPEPEALKTEGDVTDKEAPKEGFTSPEVKEAPVVEDIEEDAVAEEPVVAKQEPASIEELVSTPVEIKDEKSQEKAPEVVEKEEIPPVAIAEQETTKEEPAPVVEDPKKDEPTDVETAPVPAQKTIEVEEEDPEDAKAREEIERLNAEFAKIAAESETNEAK